MPGRVTEGLYEEQNAEGETEPFYDAVTGAEESSE